MVITTPKWGSGAKLWTSPSFWRCTCTHPYIHDCIEMWDVFIFSFYFWESRKGITAENYNWFGSQYKQWLPNWFFFLAANQLWCADLRQRKRREKVDGWTDVTIVNLSSVCSLQSVRKRKSGSLLNYLKPHPLWQNPHYLQKQFQLLLFSPRPITSPTLLTISINIIFWTKKPTY